VTPCGPLTRNHFLTALRGVVVKPDYPLAEWRVRSMGSFYRRDASAVPVAFGLPGSKKTVAAKAAGTEETRAYEHMLIVGDIRVHECGILRAG
jgi:hypothetical protein